MAEKKMKWTDQQRLAIKQRGSDVLVTASAGTGKTAVLSGRCVDIVSDKSICPDILSVLVLTFTDAAAEQMRSRIADQLRTAFLENRDQHLRHQLILLQGADISTIHSFCKRLITEYFYKVPVLQKDDRTASGKVGLDPTFRVIDGDEQGLLKSEVLEKTIDWAWQQSNLTQDLQQLLSRRDLRTNDGFLANIIETSNFLDGVISRENWCRRAMLLAEAANPFTTELGEKQKQIIADKLQRILNQLHHAQEVYRNNSTGGNWDQKLENSHVEPVRRCVELLKNSNWEKCVESIRNFRKPKTSTPKDLLKPIDELIHDIAKAAVDSFEELLDLAIVNPDYLNRVGSAVSRQTRVLVALVRKFDQLYSQAKQAVNCLDFADLEHYALRLLTDENSPEDNPRPSETALALRRRYKYIFVDEYQDINPVQQAILDLLSAGNNIFVVGDVKQSIYAWRGAASDAFLERLKSASPDPVKAPNGLRVDLNANWRSAKGILDSVNKIFSRIMTAPFANIDYDESAKLRPATEDGYQKAPEGDNKPVVELHILDEKTRTEDSSSQQTNESAGDEDANVTTPRQRQAAMIAQRIRQMVGVETGKAEFQVYDKQQNKFRSVEYRDIVILMRSLAKKANDYVEVLRLAGIPVSCQAAAGYFEATEITDLAALLKVLDNPHRDIELAAVLRSPFFKITDNELAQIKLHGKPGPYRRGFYNSLLRYSNSGPDKTLAGKLKEILAVTEQWRSLARRGNIGDLIWQIYRQSGFLSFVSALPNGQSRRANLLKLHDRAIQFEGFVSSAVVPSLTRFVGFIEKLQEAGRDWTPAEPEDAAENAVRIISVHKSKGLEFPVVFLADLDSHFNKKDIYSDFLTDAGNTLGLQVIDQQSNSKLSSLAHQVIAEQKLSTALAEEMRILYVATTRAKDRLVLTASKGRKKCRDIICNGFFFGDGPIADWQLRQCHSLLEWVLYGLSDQKNLHDVFETGLSVQAPDDDLLDIKLYGQSELEKLNDFITKLKSPTTSQSSRCTSKSQSKQAESKLFLKVKESLAWRYRFGDLWKLPAKQSVTEITHRDNEYARFDYTGALERRPRIDLSAPLDLHSATDSRLIGTVTHLAISQLNLAKPVSKETVEETKKKLLTAAVITEDAARHIDTKSIMAFFESQLGQKILGAYPAIWREWSFSFAIPASGWQLYSFDKKPPSQIDSEDDVIIVQGIIDMLVQTPDGLLIVDFKTDNITTTRAAEHAELYRRQLELYAKAATAILKTELLGKWLYFLTPRCSIEV